MEIVLLGKEDMGGEKFREAQAKASSVLKASLGNIIAKGYGNALSGGILHIAETKGDYDPMLVPPGMLTMIASLANYALIQLIAEMEATKSSN